MFERVRTRLTFTNVGVLIIMFIIFSLTIVIIMENNTWNQTRQLIKDVSAEAGINMDNNLINNAKNLYSSTSNQTLNTTPNTTPNQRENQLRYFYVTVKNTGEITENSSNLDINNDAIKKVISKALSVNKDDAYIEVGHQSYRFMRKSLDGGAKTFMVFVNTHPENEMFNHLILAITITSLFGIILAFFFSRFMADKALIPIVQSWQRQKDFVADASHELRTPLAVIQTNLELVMSKKTESVETQMKWLENVQSENIRMSRLVSDLLFLARIDSNQISMEKANFPLSTALMECYSSFESLALKKGIHLVPFESKPIEYFGDEARIKQLLVIFLDNAVKFTQSGGRISLSLTINENIVEIHVCDTGEGIDVDDIEKIFQRFYRVDKSRSRKEGSTGLGLSIAQWIVDEHQGRISVSSKKGIGTTFTVTFPLKKFKL